MSPTPTNFKFWHIYLYWFLHVQIHVIYDDVLWHDYGLTSYVNDTTIELKQVSTGK